MLPKDGLPVKVLVTILGTTWGNGVNQEAINNRMFLCGLKSQRDVVMSCIYITFSALSFHLPLLSLVF